jgi:hypothetical protein
MKLPSLLSGALAHGLAAPPSGHPAPAEKLQWPPEFDDSLSRRHFRYLTAIHNSINYHKDAAITANRAKRPENPKITHSISRRPLISIEFAVASG